MKDEIIESVKLMFTSTDERNWDMLETVMASNVYLDFSGLSGQPASTIPASEIIAAWKHNLSAFDKTHHQLSDIKISRDGTAALARYNGKADHFLGDETWTVEAAYDTELRKQGQSWVIEKHTLHLVKQSGVLDLATKAAALKNTQVLE